MTDMTETNDTFTVRRDLPVVAYLDQPLCIGRDGGQPVTADLCDYFEVRGAVREDGGIVLLLKSKPLGTCRDGAGGYV